MEFADINFDDHPVFSDSYRLSGNDEVGVRTLFNKEVIELLKAESNLAQRIDTKGSWIVIYRNNAR